MSAATYLAWNGRSYPWPPPEGWYEASDGRWWAPGSGPDPAQSPASVTETTALDTATPDPLGQVAETSPWAAGIPPAEAADPGQDDAANGPGDSNRQGDNDQFARSTNLDQTEQQADGAPERPWATAPGPLPTVTDKPSLAGPKDQGTILTGQTTTMPGPVGVVAPLGAQDGGPDARQLPPAGPLPGQGSEAGIWQPTPSRIENENRTPIFIAAGVVGVLVIAALAVIGLTRGEEDAGSALASDNTSIDDSASVGTGDESGTDQTGRQATSEQAGDSAADNTGSDQSSPETGGTDSSVAVPSTTTAAVPSTTADGATTSTAQPTTSTSVASVDTLTDTEKVREFRAILQTNGLSSDQLTDKDLIEFGTSFCIFAIAADDYDQYVDFRTEAISQSESELNTEELVLAVDGAVQVFCPDEAIRLGIGR